MLTIPEAARGLGASYPGAMLRKLRMNRHRADRAGGWRIETARKQPFPRCWTSFSGYMRTLEGEEGVFADPRVRAFHRDTAPLLLADGALAAPGAPFRSRIAAAYYALLGRDGSFFYLSAYDPDHAHETRARCCWAR